MNKPLVMGIDLGGSGVRCLLLNTETGAVVSAARSWSFKPAPDTDGLGFDLDLGLMWRLIGEASREVCVDNGVCAADIGALAVSALRFATVLLDREGEAVFTVPNRDARATGEWLELSAQGDDYLSATGMWPLPIHLSARLKWLQNRRPGLLARADCVFGLSDWLNYRLCGVKATDYSQAGCTGLFSLRERSWHDGLIDSLGVDRAIFPDAKQSGTALGRLSEEAAAHLGLSVKTVVGLGGGDSQCSLVGAGAINTGDYVCIAGTTAPVMTVVDRPLVDEQGRTWSGHHLAAGRWLVESSGGPMGETLSWLARLLFPEAPQPELRLFAEAAQSDYGARGMVSSLGAEIMDARAPSLPAGSIAMSHLSCADDPNPRRHLCRTVVEGHACAVRANLEQLEAVSGRACDSLYLTDGFSRSQVFTGILADIAAMPVKPAAQPMTSALGAALCAAVAAEVHADIPAAVAALVQHAEIRVPDSNRQTVAQKVYADWSALREVGKDSTTPKVRDHILGYVLGGDGTAASSSVAATRPAALVTAAFDQASLERLRETMEVEYASFREAGRLLTGPDLVNAMMDKQILVTEIDIVDAGALSKLPQLRVVAACRGNAVNVDVEACTAFGVPVLSAPGRNAVAVADLTVAFVLALARKLVPAADFLKDDAVTAGNIGKMGQAFTALQGRELWHKTIGLVGLGAVGRMVASRLQGFGARIIAADPFATPEAAALAGCELVDLDTLLREADFVSMHAAVTPQTTGMLGRGQFATMKASAFFINTARAALVDEEALIEAVESGRIAGAALDTFNEEPPGWDHPLVRHPNVISTPHVAGNTVEVAEHQGESVSADLLRLLRGEKPLCCLNPEVLKDFSWTPPRKQLSAAEVKALMEKPGPAVTDLDKNRKQKAARAAEPAGQVTASQDIIDNMTAIVREFCVRMSGDELVSKFSKDKDVCLAFDVPDIGLQFHIGLRGGKVDAALGVDDSAEVQLSMRAHMLDGMFSGTADTMSAAMNGDIAFIGDAAKAMAIQQLSGDMARLYNIVRKELDDPGDLASIPKPGKAGEAPALVQSVGDSDIRVELVNTVKELYEHHIITATGGNVSVRIPGKPDECWITPSQLFKGDLKPELMVRINLDGKPQDRGSRSPSSEWGFHTQTLKKKPEANAVIHAHAPYATMLCNAGIPFLPISSDAAFFGDIRRIPFTMPGSNELAELVSEALKDEWAVFMVNHGIVVAGRSLRRACDMAQIIERTAEVIIGCYQATGGKPPSVLPEEAVKLFRSLGDVIA